MRTACFFDVFGSDKSAAMIDEYRRQMTAQSGATPAISSVETVVSSLEDLSAKIVGGGLAESTATTTNNEEVISSSAAAAAAAAVATATAAATESSSSSPSATATVASSQIGRHDVVVCAWALSHVMSAQWGGTRWHDSVKRCVDAMVALIDPRTGGAVFVIETLGTDTTVPTRSNSLHQFLEEVCGFERPPRVVRTDYHFESLEQGERMCRFFFGDEVRAKFAKRYAAAPEAAATAEDDDSDAAGAPTPFVLNEVTGIWIRRVPAVAAAVSTAAASAPARRERD
jgi:hypothetical protein